MRKFLTLLAKYLPYEKKQAYAYKSVFDLDQPGVDFVLKDMARAAHMFESTYSGPGSRDDMLIAEGERNFFLRLLSILNLSPEAILELVVEEDKEVTDER